MPPGWSGDAVNPIPAPQSKPVTLASRLVARNAPSVAIGLGLRILAAGPAPEPTVLLSRAFMCANANIPWQLHDRSFVPSTSELDRVVSARPHSSVVRLEREYGRCWAVIGRYCSIHLAQAPGGHHLPLADLTGRFVHCDRNAVTSRTTTRPQLRRSWLGGQS
jgi:hypothetical protein